MVVWEGEIGADEEGPCVGVAITGERREIAAVEIAVTHTGDVEYHLIYDCPRTALSVCILQEREWD